MSFWYSASASSSASYGTHEILKHTFLLTKCCKLLFFAARRSSKLPVKVTKSFKDCFLYARSSLLMVNIIRLTAGDPVEFLSWFLNALHLALNGTKNRTSSIIYKTFLGAMKIHSQRIPPIDATDTEKDELLLTEEYVETSMNSPFLFLAADLPPPPLFKDEFRENIIPQV